MLVLLLPLLILIGTWSSSFGWSGATAEENAWAMFPILRKDAPTLKRIRPNKYAFKDVIIGPNSR